MEEKHQSDKDVKCFVHGDDCPEHLSDLPGVTTVVLHSHSISEPYLYFCEDVCPHCPQSLVEPQPTKNR